MTEQPAKPGKQQPGTRTEDPHENASERPETASQGRSDEDAAAAQSIRIESYERELREAHANPQTDEDGNVTNVADVMERYGKARDEQYDRSKS